MGVPITFLDKYNPEQFEIIGCAEWREAAEQIGMDKIGQKWMEDYRKAGGKGHYTANMCAPVYYDKNGIAKAVFKRIFIRRRTSCENRAETYQGQGSV